MADKNHWLFTIAHIHNYHYYTRTHTHTHTHTHTQLKQKFVEAHRYLYPYDSADSGYPVSLLNQILKDYYDLRVIDNNSA